MLLLFTEQAQHLQTLPQQVAGCTLKAGLPLANNTGTVFCFVFCFIFFTTRVPQGLGDGKKSASFDRDLLLEYKYVLKLLVILLLLAMRNRFLLLSVLANK